jgi:hypothetical protein
MQLWNASVPVPMGTVCWPGGVGVLKMPPVVS